MRNVYHRQMMINDQLITILIYSPAAGAAVGGVTAALRARGKPPTRVVERVGEA